MFDKMRWFFPRKKEPCECTPYVYDTCRHYTLHFKPKTCTCGPCTNEVIGESKIYDKCGCTQFCENAGPVCGYRNPNLIRECFCPLCQHPESCTKIEPKPCQCEECLRGDMCTKTRLSECDCTICEYDERTECRTDRTPKRPNPHLPMNCDCAICRHSESCDKVEPPCDCFQCRRESCPKRPPEAEVIEEENLEEEAEEEGEAATVTAEEEEEEEIIVEESCRCIDISDMCSCDAITTTGTIEQESLGTTTRTTECECTECLNPDVITDADIECMKELTELFSDIRQKVEHDYEDIYYRKENFKHRMTECGLNTKLKNRHNRIRTDLDKMGVRIKKLKRCIKKINKMDTSCSER